MPRANRLRGDGGVFHLTHRCHNRAFLLKFARDRDAYRFKVREHLRRYDCSVLDYCVTSNHVHLLIDAADRLEVSGFMREVASEFARTYNRHKHRSNAFWGDNYHATLVEDGRYLWECLCYIELNMVRCGVVGHPGEWEWNGYQEIMGQRQRYRLIDLERLCWRLGANSLDEVRQNLATGLSERIARGELQRQAHWAESLAIGSVGFLEKMQPLILWRRETEIVATTNELWALREEATPYS
ncbi:MAG: transposase [Verrucomicrobia bacterium]|nr:transposase [Verrucomicrobiota bacterium]